MTPLVRVFEGREAYLEYLAGLAREPERVESAVAEILRRVREDGDAAVLEFSERFDRVRPKALRVPSTEIDQAVAYLDPAVKDVWIQAIENVERFHERQREDSQLRFFEDGSVLGWKVTPIERVGVYIPGGKAVYPSSLIMNAVPARIAGVERIVVVSPPGPDGLPHRDILAVAALLDLDEIYAVGGAQAIAALAFGTQTIPHVYKITGPGNQYVAEAKRQVYGHVGIDSVAGPSEIVILCSVETEIEFLARDLLSQAEHDAEARALLITTRPEQARAVAARLEEIIPGLPRTEIISGSFRGGSAIVVVDNLEQGIGMVNEIAPEHLEILTGNDFETMGRIRNAGAIFLGDQTPEPVGDYFAGPNHVIPTGGRARFSSPLGVWDFIKRTTVTRYSAERLRRESDAIRLFAEREALFAHAEAVRVRTPGLKPRAAAPPIPAKARR
jgi:histidinol dehydrogenase